jgi:glyoxylase-like metal-dependent hydrolase (beta-lactamase superfamily II)
MELLPGVHVIETYANTVLLTDQRMVLVDTSMDKEPAKILDALGKLKVKPTDLTSIIITHVHGDHVNGLAALKRVATNAKVACHEIEAPFVSKKEVYPGPPRPAGHEGVPVDRKLRDGEKFEGFTVVATPGHTRGSISLHDAARRLLVAGDAVRTDGGLGPMDDQFNADPLQHRASIKRLAALEFDALVCGHGAPIRSGAGAQVRQVASRF